MGLRMGRRKGKNIMKKLRGQKFAIRKGGIMAKGEGAGFLEISFAFLLGGLVGATVALLYAPTSGEQARRRLRQKGEDVQGNLKEQYSRLSDRAEIELSRLKDRVNDRVTHARDYYEKQKAKVKEAIEEGKRTFEEEQEKEEEEMPATSNEKA